MVETQPYRYCTQGPVSLLYSSPSLRDCGRWRPPCSASAGARPPLARRRMRALLHSAAVIQRLEHVREHLAAYFSIRALQPLELHLDARECLCHLPVVLVPVELDRQDRIDHRPHDTLFHRRRGLVGRGQRRKSQISGGSRRGSQCAVAARSQGRSLRL